MYILYRSLINVVSDVVFIIVLPYHTWEASRWKYITLSATMLFDWSIVFSPPSLVIPPVSYNRLHAAVFSQTHILKRNISRRFEALSRCCFFRSSFLRRFASLCCCWDHSSHSFSVLLIFEQFFFRKFDNYFLLLFFLSSFLRCVVVEFTPATVLSLYSSFSNSFSKIRQVVASSVWSFALRCSAVLL